VILQVLFFFKFLNNLINLRSFRFLPSHFVHINNLFPRFKLAAELERNHRLLTCSLAPSMFCVVLCCFACTYIFLGQSQSSWPAVWRATSLICPTSPPSIPSASPTSRLQQVRSLNSLAWFGANLRIMGYLNAAAANMITDYNFSDWGCNRLGKVWSLVFFFFYQFLSLWRK
jgi:hypothetical protein